MSFLNSNWIDTGMGFYANTDAQGYKNAVKEGWRALRKYFKTIKIGNSRQPSHQPSHQPSRRKVVRLFPPSHGTVFCPCRSSHGTVFRPCQPSRGTPCNKHRHCTDGTCPFSHSGQNCKWYGNCKNKTVGCPCNHPLW